MCTMNISLFLWDWFCCMDMIISKRENVFSHGWLSDLNNKSRVTLGRVEDEDMADKNNYCTMQW